MNSTEIKNLMYDFLTENNIATCDEINLVTGINGYDTTSFYDILYYRTGLRSFEQCASEYNVPDGLLEYEGVLDDEEDEI